MFGGCPAKNRGLPLPPYPRNQFLVTPLGGTERESAYQSRAEDSNYKFGDRFELLRVHIDPEKAH